MQEGPASAAEGAPQEQKFDYAIKNQAKQDKLFAAVKGFRSETPEPDAEAFAEIDTLLADPDVNIIGENNRKRNILHIAIANPHRKPFVQALVRHLIAKFKAAGISVDAGSKHSPLWEASNWGQRQGVNDPCHLIAKQLVDAGADIYRKGYDRDSTNKTTAIAKFNMDVQKALQPAKQEPNTVATFLTTAFEADADNGQEFAKHIRDVTPTVISQIRFDSANLLFHLVKNNKPNCLKHLPVVDALVEAKDDNNNNFLHIYCRSELTMKQCSKFVDRAFDLAVSPISKNSTEWTPVALALQNERPELVLIMLEHQKDKASTPHNQWIDDFGPKANGPQHTMLSLARAKAKLNPGAYQPIVDILVEMGANNTRGIYPMSNSSAGPSPASAASSAGDSILLTEHKAALAKQAKAHQAALAQEKSYFVALFKEKDAAEAKAKAAEADLAAAEELHLEESTAKDKELAAKDQQHQEALAEQTADHKVALDALQAIVDKNAGNLARLAEEKRQLQIKHEQQLAAKDKELADAKAGTERIIKQTAQTIKLAEAAAVRKATAPMQARIAELEADAKESAADHTLLVEQFDAMKTVLEQTQGKFEQLRTSLKGQAEAQSQLAASNKAEAEQARADAEAARAETESVRGELTAKLATANEQLESTQGELAELKTSAEEAATQARTAVEEAQAATKAVRDELTAKLAAASKQLESTQAELADLKASAEEATAQASAAVDEAKAETEAVRVKLTAANEQLEAAQAATKQVEEQKVALEAASAEAKAEAESAQAELAEKLATANEQLESTQAELTATKKANEQEKADLQAELEAAIHRAEAAEDATAVIAAASPSKGTSTQQAEAKFERRLKRAREEGKAAGVQEAKADIAQQLEAARTQAAAAAREADAPGNAQRLKEAADTARQEAVLDIAQRLAAAKKQGLEEAKTAAQAEVAQLRSELDAAIKASSKAAGGPAPDPVLHIKIGRKIQPAPKNWWHISLLLLGAGIVSSAAAGIALWQLQHPIIFGAASAANSTIAVAGLILAAFAIAALIHAIPSMIRARRYAKYAPLDSGNKSANKLEAELVEHPELVLRNIVSTNPATTALSLDNRSAVGQRPTSLNL